MKVSQVDDFQALKNEWEYLLKNNLLGDNVFLTWEWLSTWWKHFGEGRRLLTLRVEDESEVLAIAPLMLSEYRLLGLGSVKKIEFLGTHHSDYGNFIISKKEKECLRQIIGYLKDNVANWDWIELKEVPELSKGQTFLETILPDFSPDLKMKKRICEICPYVPLPNSFNDLMEGLDRKTRKNLKYYLRRIKKEHDVELKRYDEAGFSVKEGMEIFLKLHRKRWLLEGHLGAFEGKENSFRDFHMDVSERFAEKGWLGLYFLTASGEPVAAQYTFEYRGKVYYYLGGFEPRYSDYSVGNIIIGLLLQRSIENGYIEYDLMRGFESYKTRWASKCRRNFEVRFVRKGLLNGLYDWVTWNETLNRLEGELKRSLTGTYAWNEALNKLARKIRPSLTKSYS